MDKASAYGAGDCRFRVLPRSSCSCDGGTSPEDVAGPQTVKGVARLSRQRFHLREGVDSCLGVSRWSWEHPLEPGGCSSHVSWIQDVVCCWPYPCAGKNASAGNRTRVTSMATMYSTTRPLMLLGDFWYRVYIIVFVLSVVFQEDLRLEQNPSSGAQKSKPPGAMRNRHLMGF